MITHAGLFSGIGGFSLAAEWMGWQNVFEVELDPFCRQVLHKNFPHSQLFEDVCTFNGLPFRGRIDVLSGGFPCQPFSSVGKGLGNDDPRALWHQYHRIIQEVRPRFVVAENVRGLLDKFPLAFEAVCTDLEASGYDVQPFLLPACGVGAPHRRDRFWFVAHARGTDGAPQNHERREFEPEYRQEIRPYAQAGGQALPNPNSLGRKANQQDLRRREFDLAGGSTAGRRWLTEPSLCRTDDGVSIELVRPADYEQQLKAYGNAIVPQVAYQIFQAIALSLPA